MAKTIKAEDKSLRKDCRIISYNDAKALGLKRYFTGIPCKRGHSAERQISDRYCTQCALLSSRRRIAKGISAMTPRKVAVVADKDGSLHKECSKCKRLLPVGMFNKANWLSTGLRPDCKDCYKDFKTKWWASLPKNESSFRRKELATLLEKGLRKCVRCGVIKQATEENFSITTTGKLETACRDCVKKRADEWRFANQERAKDNAYAGCAARYAEKRKRTPPWLTRAQRSAIKCIYAKARRLSKKTGQKMHVDHVVPLVGKNVSGLHVPWNLQIIPATINCRKSNRWNSLSGVDQIKRDVFLEMEKKNGTTSSRLTSMQTTDQMSFGI